jgi:hypothetical protein
MPGLRYVHTKPPSTQVFVYIPTGATLHVQARATPPPIPDTPLLSGASGGQGFLVVTPDERRLLDALPPIALDAEQLLAALLIRLPLADPDGIW